MVPLEACAQSECSRQRAGAAAVQRKPSTTRFSLRAVSSNRLLTQPLRLPRRRGMWRPPYAPDSTPRRWRRALKTNERRAKDPVLSQGRARASRRTHPNSLAELTTHEGRRHERRHCIGCADPLAEENVALLACCATRGSRAYRAGCGSAARGHQRSFPAFPPHWLEAWKHENTRSADTNANLKT